MSTTILACKLSANYTIPRVYVRSWKRKGSDEDSNYYVLMEDLNVPSNESRGGNEEKDEKEISLELEQFGGK